jgi:hypothetical protein
VCTPEQADRWTWLVIAAYTQLRVGRHLVDDLRLPWERRSDPTKLTPVRVRRGFRRLRATLGTPARTSTAGQGQTVVAAAGDDGSEDCLGSGYTNNTTAVDDPASQPFVTGAAVPSWSAAGTLPTERVWNSGPCDCFGATGGGISALWAMPTYQADSHRIGVVNAYSSGAPCGAAAGSYCREVPDVAALAGPYPYPSYVDGSWGTGAAPASLHRHEPR